MTKRFCDWCGREIPSTADGRVLLNHPTGYETGELLAHAPQLVETIELCAEGADSCWQSAGRVLRLVKEDVQAGAVRG